MKTLALDGWMAMGEADPNPFRRFAEKKWILGSVHPASRAVYVVAMLAVWFSNDFTKVLIVASVSFLMLFTVPLNPVTRPLPFVAGFLLLAISQGALHLYLELQETIQVLMLGLKVFCLACSAVVAFSGLGLSGLVDASNMVWGKLAIPIGAAVGGSQRIWEAYRAIRDTQQSRGLGLGHRPLSCLLTLLFNWFVYMADLSFSLHIQLAAKWYGSPRFRGSSLRSFGAVVDWLMTVLAFALLAMLFFA